MKKNIQCLFLLVMIIFHLFPASLNAQVQSRGPLYGTDVQLFNYSDCMDAGSKVCVAGNGWIYVMTKLWKPAVNEYIWRIYKSTDNGQTFTQWFEKIFTGGDILYDVDMAVTGSTPLDIILWVAEGYYDAINNRNEFEISKGNDYVGGFYQTWSDWWEGGMIISLAIATDYRSPGSGGDPFSVAVALSVQNNTGDYITYSYCLNGGLDFDDFNTIIYNAPSYTLGNVSLALGGTLSYDWGRYVMAFEMNMSGGLGDIGVLSNYTDNMGGSWTSPVIVNSTYAGSIGKTRNPSVAVMDNMGTDPSNPNLWPVLIAYEDYSFGSDDVDIMYNSLKDTYVMNTQPTASDFTVHWIPDAGGFNEKEPNVGFDKTYNNFLMTYTSNSGNVLPYAWCYMESLLAGNWQILPSYRDRTTSFSSWYVRPKLDINPTLAQACFSWTESDPDMTQKIFYDSEWSTVGTHDQAAQPEDLFMIYPNPATDFINIKIRKTGSFLLQLKDPSGKEVRSWTLTGGLTTISLDHVVPGIYLLHVSGKDLDIFDKIIVH